MIHIQESWLQMEPKEYSLLQPGNYFFQVKSAEAKVSNAGNEMIALCIEVASEHRTHLVYDYLVGSAAAFWKVKNFCFAVGLSGALKAGGSISETDCLGKKGKVKITIDPGTNGYSDRNTVEDYVAAETFSTKGDDGIPF